MQHRIETRKERSGKKQAKTFPFEVCTINFQVEENVAFVIRAAACFGATAVNIIGSIPERKELNRRSGSNQDYVKINQFSNPNTFLKYIKENNISLVCAEMNDDADSIYDFVFPLNKRFCIVVGHETSGIPVEILMNSQKVFIPMPGKGFNLNTSQAANIFLYEASKQYV